GALARDTIAGALHELRHARKDRRWISLGRGCLADRERDFSLRLSEACQRIHDEQHTAAAVTKIFSDGRRQPRAMQSHERRMISGSGNHYRTRESGAPQDALDEFLYLAPALPDKSD